MYPGHLSLIVGLMFMNDLARLEQATAEFFRRHWHEETLSIQRPDWKNWDKFLNGSVPNYDLGGCYSLFSGLDLLYIGLGASKGGGIYTDHGLSRRLMAHVIASDQRRGREWSKLREAWNSVTSIQTIGFPNEFSYLAAALETFLIRELNPPRNSRV